MFHTDGNSSDRFLGMNADLEAEIRLWAITKIAEVLTDLADDPDEEEPIDREELFDQLKSVGEMIFDALNIEILSSDGRRATATFGDD
jgi:hypothetical protein